MDTAELIFQILEQRGMEQKEFARLIGVSEKVVSTWSTGRAKSYAKHLEKIAEVLNTTTDYLLTGKESQTAPVLPEDQLTEAIVAEFITATPEEKAQALAYLHGLKAARKAATFPGK